MFLWFIPLLVQDLILLIDVLSERQLTSRFVTSKLRRGTFLQPTLLVSPILAVSHVPPELPVFRPTHRQSSKSLTLRLAALGPGPQRPLFTPRRVRFNVNSYFRPLTCCRWLFFGSSLKAWRCFCCFSPRVGWSSSKGCPGSRWRWTHTCWSGWKSWCFSWCRSPGSPLGAPDCGKIFKKFIRIKIWTFWTTSAINLFGWWLILKKNMRTLIKNLIRFFIHVTDSCYSSVICTFKLVNCNL